MSNKTCIWIVRGVNCSGRVDTYKLMNAQIQVPICQAHAQSHNIIMTLRCSKNMDIEEILQMTEKQRRKLVKGTAIVNDAEIVKE